MNVSLSNFMMLYGAAEDSTVKLKVRLIDPIDETVLSNAFNVTMHRFPYYCGKYVRDGEIISYVEDSLPFKVFHKPVDDGTLNLGSEEADFHLVAVEWDADVLCLDMSHAVTNETGMYRVLHASLYRYCKAKYDPDLPAENSCRLEDMGKTRNVPAGGGRKVSDIVMITEGGEAAGTVTTY